MGCLVSELSMCSEPVGESCTEDWLMTMREEAVEAAAIDNCNTIWNHTIPNDRAVIYDKIMASRMSRTLE